MWQFLFALWVLAVRPLLNARFELPTHSSIYIAKQIAEKLNAFNAASAHVTRVGEIFILGIANYEA